MARLRSTPAAQKNASSPQATRKALKETTNVARATAPDYEDDGDTEGLVKAARPTKRRRIPRQNEEELVMAGGLGLGGAQARTEPVIEALATAGEMVKSDEGSLRAAKTNRRPPRMTRKVVQSEAQSTIFADMKKRMQATARHETGAQKNSAQARSGDAASPSDAPRNPAPVARREADAGAERSEFSLSPFSPPPRNLGSVQKRAAPVSRPGSALKVHGTPTVETSILALKNFKRRPRQPSMLQMVQQRTATARPSAGNAATTQDPGVFDFEDDGEIEEDFAPEAEGTPLKMSKPLPKLSTKDAHDSPRLSKSTRLHQAAGASSKRKSDKAQAFAPSCDSSSVKRRRRDGSPVLVVQVQRSRSAEQAFGDRTATSQLQDSLDVQVIESSPLTMPLQDLPSPDRQPSLDNLENAILSTEKDKRGLGRMAQISTQGQAKGTDGLNGALADPASSSPLPDEPSATQRTDIMADPLTQVSPRPQRQKQKKPPKPMTTAALQTLLPKRRQPLRPRHHKSVYDIDSGSEDDEGSQAGDDDGPGGRSRRKTRPLAPKRNEATAAKGKPRKSKAAASSRKSTAPPVRKKGSKTYGGPTAMSDKENHNDDDDAFESLDENDESALPDTSISMLEASGSKELEEAKRKFEEVDDWEMEFESMSQEDHRSSSQTWR